MKQRIGAIVDIDSELVERAQAIAAEEGRPFDEILNRIFERAVQDYVSSRPIGSRPGSVVDEIWGALSIKP